MGVYARLILWASSSRIHVFALSRTIEWRHNQPRISPKATRIRPKATSRTPDSGAAHQSALHGLHLWGEDCRARGTSKSTYTQSPERIQKKSPQFWTLIHYGVDYRALRWIFFSGSFQGSGYL